MRYYTRLVTLSAGLAILLGVTANIDAQVIYGTLQGNMRSPTGNVNYSVSSVHDYTVSPSVLRLWWSCGVTASFCYGENAYYVGTDIVSSNFGFCDSSDPSVVLFNGTWYMYVTAIPNGDPGCGGRGGNGRIYAFGSSDARNWTLLNGGNPVIWNGPTTSYGTGQPSAVVMNYAYACSGGQWQYYPTTPYIRVYYTQFGNEPQWPHHLYAMDSYDGVTFTAHTDASGNQGILNGPNVDSVGWYPSVKKVGINGDYPLVIGYWSYSLNTPVTAVTTGPSDFSWTGGGGGTSLPLSPPGQDVHLEGDTSGIFLNTLGGGFSGEPSGQVNLWWSPSNVQNIYLGQADAAMWFPWSTSLGSCQ